MEHAGPAPVRRPSARFAPGMDATRVRLRVPREHTQPPGDELLSHAELMGRLDALGRSGRARVETIGTSHEGRAIPLVVVAGSGAVGTTADGGGPVPILFVAGEYGYEASSVQGLLELAEELAHDAGHDLEAALRSVVVLIVPLVAPDAYERSRGEWTQWPLSSGLSGDGSHDGVGVAVEYLHSEQPEALALKAVIARWQPVLVWRSLEDELGLGRSFSEVALVAPVAPADGNASAGLSRQLGAAIAEAWRAEGFDVLHDPAGRDERTLGPQSIGAQPGPDAGFGAILSRQGILGLVTASSRTPGSQSWRDRNRQKRIAGRVLVEESAARHADLRRLRHHALRATVQEDADGVYLIPSGQDPAAVRRAVGLLQGLGIGIHQSPAADAAIAVPRRQPLKAVADLLLSRTRGGALSLVSTIGLTVVESDAFSGAVAVERRTGRLTNRTGRSGDGTVAFAGLDALRAVNRVLRIPGGRVSWRDDGAFEAWLPPGRHWFADVVDELELVDGDQSAGHAVADIVRAPRVAVYAGQGVRDLPRTGGLGRVRRYLRTDEFDATLVGPGDIAGGALDGVDVLLVPAGDAGEILRGWSDAHPLRRFPWDSPGPPEGLAGAGLVAIRAFVTAGGTFVGLGGGGGSFATRDHAHLIDADIADTGSPVHLTTLRPETSGDLLFAGLTGPVDVPHGTSFSSGPAVRRLAGYGPDAPSDRAVDQRGGAAIVEAVVDAGSVVLFGFDPAYRPTALRSARLLGRSILRAVSTQRRAEDGTHTSTA